MPSPLLRWLPSPALIQGAVIALILAAVSATKGLVDPDYWWHLTAGELILESGVPTVDPFSFTWNGKPWTPHEWASEALLFLGVSGIGAAGVLVVFGAVAGASIAIMGVTLQRTGVRTVAVLLPSVLAAVVFIPYVTARPQAISWLLLALELALLMHLRADRPARTLWLVPLFVAWANLHGLYVVGLGVLGVYLLFTLVGRTPMAGASRWMVAASVGSALASTLTPAGPVGLLYPLRYIDSSDWGLANIAEWQSPDFHDPAHLAFLALIVAMSASGGRATPGWLAFLAIVGLVMGLLALRNAPISALLSLPMLAYGADALLARSPARRPPPASLAAGRRIIELGVAAVIVVGAWLVLVPADVGEAAADAAEKVFPVEAIQMLQRQDPDARVVVEYGWAGYAIHELHGSGGRVFVDGRNDMYPESLLADYSAIRAGDPGFDAILERHGAEWLLFPPETTITRGPAAAAGWCEFHRDQQAVLLRRCQ